MLSALLVSAALLAQVPTPPDSFTLADSYHGDVALTRINAKQWSGVKVVALPSSPSCGPATFPLRYWVVADGSSMWELTTQYRTANPNTNCPAAAGTIDRFFTARIDPAVRNPATGRPGTTFAVNGTVPGTQCWPPYRNVTLSLAIP